MAVKSEHADDPHRNEEKLSDSTKIPKGSHLKEWIPYMVVPLYGCTGCSGLYSPVNDGNSNKDPTNIPGIENLPLYNGCPVWDYNDTSKRNNGRETTKDPKLAERSIFQQRRLQKFLCKIRRQSNNTNADTQLTKRESWNALCILSLLHIVQKHYNNAVDIGQNDGNKAISDTIWSTVEKECKDTITAEIFDDNDDEEESLVVELWPLIQDYIPWTVCQKLFIQIRHHLHMITIPHPLTKYAQETIFQLSGKEFEKCWKIVSSIVEKNSVVEECHSSTLPHRLRVSQLLLDLVANMPERIVGVLLQDPMSQNTFTSSKQSTNGNSFVPKLQSCIPNTCLEVVDGNAKKETIHDKIPKIIWIALFDINCHQHVENWTVRTRPRKANCSCFLCLYEKDKAKKEMSLRTCNINIDGKLSFQSTDNDLRQAQILAHYYLQQELYDEAFVLYKKCHDNVRKNCCDNESRTVTSSSPSTVDIAADLWHCIGGVLLSQAKFAKAQQHWRKGSQYVDFHEGIREQYMRQIAYQYFQPLSQDNQMKIPKYQNISDTSRSVFIASNVVEKSTCQQLIEWASEYATNNGGWTTRRHYAVPTIDLPVHQVPRLLEWFQDFMPTVLFPLLHDQFEYDQESQNGKCKRFYVHDAFLVRYEATSSSHFLPMHYDESTHSCVLALNDDYMGGGTYMYHLGQSITPSTGSLVSFRGNKCLHGGNPVTHGVRYILTIFLYFDQDLCSLHAQEQMTDVETANEKNFGGKKRNVGSNKDCFLGMIEDEDDSNSKRRQCRGFLQHGNVPQIMTRAFLSHSSDKIMSNR